MRELSFRKLKKIVRSFNDRRILVIGDLMLDEFVWGTVGRISPEAPVPVVKVASESFMPGGASNVSHNVQALGGRACIAGVAGLDERGDLLVEELKKRGIEVSGIVRDSERPTTLKTRVIAHHQQVVRIDREAHDPISDNVIEQILTCVRKSIKSIDAIIIEDYGKGVIVPNLIEEVIRIARRHKRIITVDPKESHFPLYRKVTAITPNHQEAAQAVHTRPDETGLSVERIGAQLRKKFRIDNVIITLGEEGMCVCDKSGKVKRIPTVAQDVFDVSGAGDTVISAYTLAICAKARNIEAAHIANCAAGVVVGKVGIGVSTQEELIEKISEEMHKVRAGKKTTRG